MSAPSSTHIREELAFIARTALELVEQYEDAAGMGYERQNSTGEKLRGSGISDPVGMTVVSRHHGKQRSSVERAAKAIYSARVQLQTASKALDSILAEGRASTEPSYDELPELSEAELDDLYALQDKRRARGVA